MLLYDLCIGIGSLCTSSLRLHPRPLLVLGDARAPQPVNLFPCLAVVDELAEYNKVQADRAETAHEPGEALDQVVALSALEQDAGDVGQVAGHSKDEQREREAFALCGA